MAGWLIVSWKPKFGTSFRFFCFFLLLLISFDSFFRIPGAILRRMHPFSPQTVPIGAKTEFLPEYYKPPSSPGRTDVRMSHQLAPFWPGNSASDAELPQESENAKQPKNAETIIINNNNIIIKNNDNYLYLVVKPYIFIK